MTQLCDSPALKNALKHTWLQGVLVNRCFHTLWFTVCWEEFTLLADKCVHVFEVCDDLV